MLFSPDQTGLAIIGPDPLLSARASQDQSGPIRYPLAIETRLPLGAVGGGIFPLWGEQTALKINLAIFTFFLAKIGQNGPKMPQNGPNLGENVRKHFCIQDTTTYHCLQLPFATYSLIQEKCHIVFCTVKWGDSGHFLRFLSHRSPENCLEIIFFFFFLHYTFQLCWTFWFTLGNMLVCAHWSHDGVRLTF